MFHGITLATLYRVMLWQLQNRGPDILAVVLAADIMIGMMGVFPFAGTEFLEIKDQLWMTHSAPMGASHSMRARLISRLLISLPIALVPSAVVGLAFGIDVLFFLLLLVSAYLVVWGAVIVSIGITAQYPSYEDTKSRAYVSVVLSSMVLTALSVIAPLLLDMFGLLACFSLFDFLESNFATIGFDLLMVFTGSMCLLLVGALMMKLGTGSMSRAEE